MPVLKSDYPVPLSRFLREKQPICDIRKPNVEAVHEKPDTPACSGAAGYPAASEAVPPMQKTQALPAVLF